MKKMIMIILMVAISSMVLFSMTDFKRNVLPYTVVYTC
jgi:hypothetical protein